MAIDYTLSDDGIALITINRPERLNALGANIRRVEDRRGEPPAGRVS